jgi:plasmid stabilization system protein ParE
MSAYVLSPDALQDLQEIWDYIANDNAHAADEVLDDLFNAFESLVLWPRQGHSRSDLTHGNVRFWPVDSYLVVYRETATALQIVAILHGARDIPKVIGSRLP